MTPNVSGCKSPTSIPSVRLRNEEREREKAWRSTDCFFGADDGSTRRSANPK